MLIGWKTVLWNVALVALTAALQAVAGFDWVTYVGETPAVMIIAGINLLLRWFTVAPIFDR